MQDAAGEVELRDEEGGIRSDFLHAVASALEADDAAKVRELTLPLHEADLADLIQLLRPEQRGHLISTLGDDFKPGALPELDESVRDQVHRGDAHRAGGGGSAAARLRRGGLSDRGPRQGRAVGHPRQAAVLRARGARAEPRISGGLGRPHHADRSHRRAALLVGRPDDRLYERGRRPSRPLLRSVRGRSRPII